MPCSDNFCALCEISHPPKIPIYPAKDNYYLLTNDRLHNFLIKFGYNIYVKSYKMTKFIITLGGKHDNYICRR